MDFKFEVLTFAGLLEKL